MNLTKTWIARILLGGVAFGGLGGDAWAQTWQPVSTADDGASQVDWQQRVLKRPSQPLRWQPAQQQPADSYQPAADDYPAASPKQTNTAYRTARRSFDADAVFDGGTMPKEPVASPRQRAPVAESPEVIPPGTTDFEPVASEGVFAGNGGCATCGGDGGPCDTCGGPSCGDCCPDWEIFDGRCGPWLRGLSVFSGVDAFRGPPDRTAGGSGNSGNFGVNEGLNLARPLGDPWGCGYQLGANFVQSNFSGAPNFTVGDYDLRAPFRRQYFATAGLFRRADECGGFQWGVAYDYLQDNYYQTNNLQQIRSETSFVLDDTYDIGYYGVYGVGTSRVIDGRLDPTDMFVLFLRRRFENGGDGRLWGGATGNGDGVLGADLWIPLGGSFAIENRVNYLIPKEGRGDTAQSRESWGLTIQLVWYPGQSSRCERKNPYRPMFNVADNSLFMVDRLTH